MRVALVGPAHPQKGGITQHTTALGRELDAHGHDVVHVGWSAPYPRALYPGEVEVHGPPEVASPVAARLDLRWWDPVGWWRTGGAVASGERAVLVLPATPHVPALRVIARRCSDRGTPTTLIAHNVAPHEPRPGDTRLIGGLVRSVGRVVVHTDAEADRAVELGAREVRMHALAPTLPEGTGSTGTRADDGTVVALVFGLVRPYKGVDLAVRALAEVPGARLVVAGEFWSPIEELRVLAAALGVADRVDLRPGYVEAADLSALFASSDVVLAPYRSATGSQNASLARAFGRPIIATRVGGLGGDVRDEVDGILVPPGDVDALAAAWRSVLDPERRRRLTAAAAKRGAGDVDQQWATYVDAVVGA